MRRHTLRFPMIDWLLTPSSFEDDPKGFALNQLGHLALGAALAWAGEALGLHGVLTALALCAAWECAHLARGGEISDGLEDAAFVGLGAAALGDPTWLLAAAPFLASGVARRAGL